MTAAEHDQLEIERIQKLSDIVNHKDDFGAEFQTHVWADSDTVYVNIRSGVAVTSFHLTKDAADILADQLSIALRRW